MRQADILETAAFAAQHACTGGPSPTTMAPLYAYALERRAIDKEKRFPTPEVLGRKLAELSGTAYPHRSIADAPVKEQMYLVTFRAVIEALEPFREPTEQLSAAELEAAIAAHQEMAADAAEPTAAPPDMQEIRIVFEPISAEAVRDLRFIDVETIDGKSIEVGTWLDVNNEGFHSLCLTVHTSDIRAKSEPGAPAGDKSKKSRKASK